MQARKAEGRSKKTTKASPHKPTKTHAKKPSERLTALKAVKAPVAAKTGKNGRQVGESKASSARAVTKADAKPKASVKPKAASVTKTLEKKASATKTSATKADATKTSATKTSAKPRGLEARGSGRQAKPTGAAPSGAVRSTTSAGTEASRSEPSKSNASFARPSPWSAPALPPVKVDTTISVSPTEEGDFHVGETVVYPARGVADIVGVEEKEIGGRRQGFYVLRVHDTEQKILVPVNNAAQIGLRRPISEAQVREIFRILKITDIPLDTQTWNRRYRGFVEKLATGSVFAVAEVLRDLSRVKIVKEGLSFSERQMLERARGLIVKEIAVARAKSEDVVRQQIEAIFA